MGNDHARWIRCLTNLFAASLFAATFQLPGLAFAAGDRFAEAFEGADANTIHVRLTAGNFRLIDAPASHIHRKKGDITVRMAGFTEDDSPGDPTLPYRTYHLALPPDADLSTISVEILHLDEAELDGPISISPAPPPPLNGNPGQEALDAWELNKWGIGKTIVDGRNVSIYGKDAFHPATHALVAPSGQMRKWKAVAIDFYPIRYNPVGRTALLARELQVKVRFQRLSEPPAQLDAMLRDRTMDPRAEKLFLNYDRARYWYRPPVPGGTDAGSGPAKDSSAIVDPSLLIVTTEHTRSNSAELANFCFHKQDLGHSVMILTEHESHTVTGTPGAYAFTVAPGGYEDVAGAQLPAETPQKIRKWLMDNYLALGVHHVLLMGDPDPNGIDAADHVGDIPMLMSWPNLLDNVPTDMYYADLTGDWNPDGDAFFGERYALAGDSTLPAGVGGELFSVRWDGVIDVDTADPTAAIRLWGYLEGRTRIWLDTANDGITDADLILDDPDEHHPTHLNAIRNLADGSYPLRLEYRQSAGDAYLSINLESLTDGATATFRHDTGGGVLADELVASYYATDDLTGATTVVRNEPRPNAVYIIGGDRGIGGVDLYPEVIIGRIPFYDEDGDDHPDVAILDGILAKIIDYENANVRDEDWRRRALCSTPYMYDSDDPDSLYDIADYMGCETLRSVDASPPLWQWYRIHEEDYGVGAEVTDGCTADKMVAAWNDPADPDDGRGMVMWRTHGSQTSASHVFYQARCVDLDDTKPSFVIQTTCLNGKPDTGLGGPYPLAYSLLKQGAVATVAASRVSSGGTFDPAIADVSRKNNPYLMYFLAKGIANNVPVGEVVAHVRESDATTRWAYNQMSYNLYGDPTVSLFGSGPKSGTDTVLVLDGSGSMLSEGKWQAAKGAAILYRDLAEALRHPGFQDRYNTVVFRCISDSDGSSTVPAGSGLKAIDQPLTMAQLDAFEPEGVYFTPIGGGLQTAYAQFDPADEDGFYANRVLVLLSDGKHNCGTDPLSIPVPDGVVVHSVGLGEDNIEPETIRDIADLTGGDYRISPSPREIEDFFVQILASTSWKLQDIPVTDGVVPIDQDRAVFLTVWDDPGRDIQFSLDPPGSGANVTPTGVPPDYPGMSCDYHAAAAGSTHAFYDCDGIPAALLGEWQFVDIEDSGTAVAPADVMLKVVEDPRVIADYGFDEGEVFTGQPIRLTARITEDGRPMTGLTEVYAELVRSPALAIGTLMADQDPKTPPKAARIPADRTTRADYLLRSMEAAGIATLNSTGGPRIPLVDDGTAGDLIAGDGIYTGLLRDTRHEGSYSFEFRTSGTNSAGVPFERGETLSELVKFGASATTTDIAFLSDVFDKDENQMVATLLVTPKDAFGAFLGPFRGDLIRLWSSEGSISPDYLDRRDGSYEVELRYAPGASPAVSVVVGDVFVAERLPVEVEETGYPWWLFLLVLLILLVALYLFLVQRTHP